MTPLDGPVAVLAALGYALEMPSPSRDPHASPRSWGEFTSFAAIVSALAYGSWLRVSNARDALLFGDEWHSLQIAIRDWSEILHIYGNHGSGLALPLLQRLSFEALGFTPLVARLPALLGGLLTIAVTILCARRMFDATVGWVAGAFVALNSFLIFYSGFGRSYSLVAALGILYLASAQAVVEKEDIRRPLAGFALCAAFLPWLHLTSAGLLACVGAATLALLVVQKRPRAAAGLMLAGLAGALGCWLLHLSAWDSLLEFVGSKVDREYYGDFGPMDVVSLFFGDRILTAFALTAGVLASLALARCHGARAVPLLAAIVGPPVVLALARPFGDSYAYSRYLIAVVPAFFVLLAWAVAASVRRLLPDRATGAPVLVAGLVLATIGFMVGSYGPRQLVVRPFSNTYLSLFPLPAFDQPYPGTPDLYAKIAADAEAARVLEVPYLKPRSVQTYRIYALTHGKDVVLGFLSNNRGALPDNYVSLKDPQWLEKADADWLVLHRNPLREVDRYWEYVFGDLRELADAPTERAYMTRMKVFSRAAERPNPALIQNLRRTLGPPTHTDEDLLAWRLRDGPG